MTTRADRGPRVGLTAGVLTGLVVGPVATLLLQSLHRRRIQDWRDDPFSIEAVEMEVLAWIIATFAGAVVAGRLTRMWFFAAAGLGMALALVNGVVLIPWQGRDIAWGAAAFIGGILGADAAARLCGWPLTAGSRPDSDGR